jgi:hypothetical protein
VTSLIMRLISIPFMSFANVEGASDAASAKQLCAEFRDCNQLNGEATTKCLKDALLNVGLTKKRLDGGQARTMGPSLINAGFQDLGKPRSDKVPEGAILIVQPSAGCAGDSGTILMKCQGEWIKRTKVAVAPKCPRKVFIHPKLQ